MSESFQVVPGEILGPVPETWTSGAGPDQRVLHDLNLDQVVEAVARGWEESGAIAAVLAEPLHDVDAIEYRQEVFLDLEDPVLFEQVSRFVDRLRDVRSRLAALERMHSSYQREGWLLDTAGIYCEATLGFARELGGVSIGSRGLRSFRDFLESYVASEAFLAFAAATKRVKEVLAAVRYCVRIKGRRVEVSRYEDETDYSAEVLVTFERFKQDEAKDYLVKYRGWPGMNHVGERILELVARLFEEEFSALEHYCGHFGRFYDSRIRRFERDVQFYLAFNTYTKPLRDAGLDFCYPEIVTGSKLVYASSTFDLPLARKLVLAGAGVVTNDFELRDSERIFVVSGPNQGGKTTFARTFGQLHHLASVGCPIPGTGARAYLFDRIFTHFEREEDLGRMAGKLEDDIVRIRGILETATSRSILIMNEIFTSTTLRDARFLGRKVIDKAIDLDALCVYVTFVDELASLGASVVSMVSTVVPGNPAKRTFKVVRGPADGRAYALAIAESYGLTRERLSERLAR